MTPLPRHRTTLRPGPSPALPRAGGVAGLAALLLVAAPFSAVGAAAAQEDTADAPERERRPVSVPAPPATSAEEVAEFVDSLARSTLEEAPAAGMSVAVLRGGDTLAMAGWGRADLEHDVRATAETVYRIGSVTKQFTAAAILRQVEAGRLSLGDTLRAYVPAFDPGGPPVTVRQLLTHTSGIASYTSLREFWEKARTKLGHGELLDLVEDEPMLFEPGRGHAYSNTGYYLLGMILEEVTRQPYGTHLRDSLLAPLGLDRTRSCARRPIVPGRAEGYRTTDDGSLVDDDPLSMENAFSAGGLCSTVGDLVAWTRALHAGRVVSGTSLEAMTSPVELPDGPDTGYGFGLVVTEVEGHRRLGHGGSINGFASHLAHYPDDDLTVAVLVNTRDAPAEQVGERIARKALGLPQPEVLDLPLTGAEARRYTGEYMVVDQALPVQITLEDGRLVAQPAGQPAFELMHQGRHRFRAGYDPGVTLTFRMDDGRAVGFVLRRDARVFRADRVEREPARPPD